MMLNVKNKTLNWNQANYQKNWNHYIVNWNIKIYCTSLFQIRVK